MIAVPSHLILNQVLIIKAVHWWVCDRGDISADAYGLAIFEDIHVTVPGAQRTLFMLMRLSQRSISKLDTLSIEHLYTNNTSDINISMLNFLNPYIAKEVLYQFILHGRV